MVVAYDILLNCIKFRFHGNMWIHPLHVFSPPGSVVVGFSWATLKMRGLSLPYFLRVKRGGIIQRPPCDDRLACLYPAAVEPGEG